jgi:hypothetical protein
VLFVPPPGPSSEAAREVAKKYVLPSA